MADQRCGARVVHGEFKTPGGKLVIVDYRVENGHLRDVVVSGDFFLEPPEALDSIIATLNGLPADSDASAYALAIQSALDDDVVMVGFTPEAIATAIQRGREA